MSLEKIVSGGQTGADRAALEAAQLYGLKTGGYAPPGFVTESGRDYELKTRFGLEEIARCSSLSAAYVARSKMNVDAADATLVFRTHASPGTDKTIGYCMTGAWANPSSSMKPRHRPVLIMSHCVAPNADVQAWEDAAEKLCVFLLQHKVRTLNVAGHRSTPADPTWQQRVLQFMVYALHRCLYCTVT